MGPKCNHKGPCKTEARGSKERAGHVTMEVEFGMMWPQTKALEAGSDKEQSLPWILQKEPACSNLDVSLWSYKRLNLCVLSH